MDELKQSKILSELTCLRKECDCQIKASEEFFAPGYKRNKKLYKRLIALFSDMEDKISGYFKGLSHRSINYVDWREYSRQLKTIQGATKPKNIAVNITLDDQESEGTMLRIEISELLIEGTVLGALNTQELTKIDLGVNSAIDWIQSAAINQGEKVVKGVTDTTLDRINQSLNTSISLGEDIKAASQRLQTVIEDPMRAEMIARTETVNAWANGVKSFGQETGAKTKTWTVDGNPCSICQENGGVTVAFDDVFPSGDDSPTAHPNCLCEMTVGYDESEID